MSQPDSAIQSRYQPESTHSGSQTQTFQTAEEQTSEARRIRHLQRLIQMVMLLIRDKRDMPVEEASALVADTRRAALVMFPDKASAFDLLYWPRLQRLMRERYRMQ